MSKKINKNKKYVVSLTKEEADFFARGPVAGDPNDPKAMVGGNPVPMPMPNDMPMPMPEPMDDPKPDDPMPGEMPPDDGGGDMPVMPDGPDGMDMDMEDMPGGDIPMGPVEP